MIRSDEAGSVESFELDNEQIEITYVTEDGKGRYLTPGYESWPYPEGSFPERTVTLAGITLRAVSAAGLLDMKEGWEENLGEKPRPHDLADIEALRDLLGVTDRSMTEVGSPHRGSVREHRCIAKRG